MGYLGIVRRVVDSPRRKKYCISAGQLARIAMHLILILRVEAGNVLVVAVNSEKK